MPGASRSFTGANMVPRNSTAPSGYWWCRPIICATRSSGSRLILPTSLDAFEHEAVGARHVEAHLRAAHVVEREGLVEQPDERADRASRRCCPWPCESSSAERPSTSRRFTSLPSVAPTIFPFEVATTTTSGSGLFQVEDFSTPIDMPVPTDGQHLALGEDLGVRPDADLEILRPQALLLQQLLQLHRLRRAGLDLLDRAAERALDLGAGGRRTLRRAACLLLDHALEQRDREGDAGRLHGLQVDRREQPRLARCRACLRSVFARMAARSPMRSPLAPATPAAGSGDSHRSRMVANEREMSNTPSCADRDDRRTAELRAARRGRPACRRWSRWGGWRLRRSSVP